MASPIASPRANPRTNAPTDKPTFAALLFSSSCSDFDNLIVNTVSLGSSVFFLIFISTTPSHSTQNQLHPKGTLSNIFPRSFHEHSIFKKQFKFRRNCNYSITVITLLVKCDYRLLCEQFVNLGQVSAFRRVRLCYPTWARGAWWTRCACRWAVIVALVARISAWVVVRRGQGCVRVLEVGETAEGRVVRLSCVVPSAPMRAASLSHLRAGSRFVYREAFYFGGA